MEIVYKTLEGTAQREIHQTFLAAFSDYIVDIRMTETAFREMNELRAVDLALSVGAFSEEKLIGFTLNAYDLWQGQRTGYDSGTGVIPEFRGLGVSKALMQKSVAALREKGAENYLLEVIVGNDRAFKLYQNLGFQITRRLECLILKNSGTGARAKSRFALDIVPNDQWQRLEGLGGFKPSWQNSWNTLRRGAERYRTVACWDRKECLGFGTVALGKGSIAQLWVRPDCRRLGLGQVLLDELRAISPGHRSYAWVNVDGGAVETLAFLEAMGFTKQISQYEMEYRLQPRA